MAKMSDVAPVTEYQLVQLASVAVAVGRAENVPLTAALLWLSRQVDDGQLSARLYDIPISNGCEIGVWSVAGDDRQWKLIQKKAAARQWDAEKMPTITQSRYLHVDDLAQLAASADTSKACRAALLELVAQNKLRPRQTAIPSHPAEATPTAELTARPVTRQEADWKTHAREVALAILKRAAKQDLYPPQDRVADEVAEDLRSRRIFGADGKPLTGSTIKRHALRGISSAAKKALSTTRVQGKQGK
jgi:hypothetical protein